jgi:hypothetical protein
VGEVVADSAAVGEAVGDISLDLVALVAGAAEVAVVVQTSVLELVRRSRNLPQDLPGVRRSVGLMSDSCDWVRIGMSSGNNADLTLSLGFASAAAVDLGAFGVAVVELEGLAGDKVFDSAMAEVVAEETGRKLEVVGSNLIPAGADRKMTCVVVAACRTELDMLPDAAVVADESLAAAVGACTHPFAAPGLCNNSPSLLPQPLVPALMQCSDTSLLAAY